MAEQNLYSQEGMERSLRAFVKHLATDFPDTINSGMALTLEECSFAEKTAVFSCEIPRWMSNPGGVTHGGMVAGLLDSAIGSVTYYFSGEKLTPTISLQITFVRPMVLEKRTWLKVSLSSCGRTMGNATAEAWQEGAPDRVIATASGTYYTG
ncbi:MAG: PaaI family thioesterase [Oscillospiraceae bacterium]|nr:PaaI family thioesterase [Oscillospiraceae bacterium]